MHADFALTDVEAKALALRFGLDKASDTLERKLRLLEVQSSVSLDFAGLVKTAGDWLVSLGVDFRLAVDGHDAHASSRVVLHAKGASIEAAVAEALGGAVDAVLARTTFNRGHAA